MKKLVLIIAVVLLNNYSFGQTNRLLPDGNAGIGTTTPTAKLEIVSPSSNYTNNIKFGDTAPAYLASGTSGIYFSNTNGNPLFMIQHTGNAGFGTVNPVGNLDVNGSQVLEWPNVPAQIVISNSADATKHLLLGYDNLADVAVISASESGVKWKNLVISPYGGNVGIGINNPTDALDVNGTIHAREVKVDLNGWSDYVLKPAYRLLPLNQVKLFIDQNYHLPEIPSEKEVINNGLSLGDMNKLLMKKVEELTLYLIEKDQQINKINKKQLAQNKVNEKLQKQLAQIQKKLNAHSK
ncbi:hypothetical protein [Pedobacter sp. L105]|uniref:hypothetical protein n=1 Tax=Pedobacter sp. L105 TaxID=1641871 RepID=UPI00131C3F1D|nr:hypothetical protein [Pedobacter sp. L105]